MSKFMDAYEEDMPKRMKIIELMKQTAEEEKFFQGSWEQHVVNTVYKVFDGAVTKPVPVASAKTNDSELWLCPTGFGWRNFNLEKDSTGKVVTTVSDRTNVFQQYHALKRAVIVYKSGMVKAIEEHGRAATKPFMLAALDHIEKLAHQDEDADRNSSGSRYNWENYKLSLFPVDLTIKEPEHPVGEIIERKITTISFKEQTIFLKQEGANQWQNIHFPNNGERAPYYLSQIADTVIDCLEQYQIRLVEANAKTKKMLKEMNDDLAPLLICEKI